MSLMPEQRRQQLETFSRTVYGRERILNLFEAIRGPTPVPPPVDEMIEAILVNQFESNYVRRSQRGP